jgi:transcriptional regulator with XRE-family HTH domain
VTGGATGGITGGARRADPGRVVTQQDFGQELTRLRQDAGLTVRQVARRAELPNSTAGDYFAGRHLPPMNQPDVLARIVRACGVTGDGELRRWQDAAAAARRGPGRRDAPAARPPRGGAPYRGLASFRPADAPWFFGREELTGQLVAMAAAARADGQPLAVVGQSGSGKSSLLAAGLVPALMLGQVPGPPPAGPPVTLTPGARPLAALAAGLGADPAALIRPGPEPPVPPIIVDQFEQVFTCARTRPSARRSSPRSARWRRGPSWWSACGPTATVTRCATPSWPRP